MTTYTFREITARAERSGKCPGCGKRVKRSRTFEQTVNPFNKNADGLPKTPSEVRGAVQAEAASWQPAPLDLYHEKCLNELDEDEVSRLESEAREQARAHRAANRPHRAANHEAATS